MKNNLDHLIFNFQFIDEINLGLDFVTIIIIIMSFTLIILSHYLGW